MRFHRPQNHGQYLRQWEELLGMIPWQDPQVEGVKAWLPRVEDRDFENRCADFVRYARVFFRKDLYALMRFGLSHGDRIHANVQQRWLDQPWLFDRVRRVDQRYRDGTLHGVWLNWSRRHWKSSTLQALCVKACLDALAEGADLVIHYYSSTIPQAIERIGDIRRELETNELMQRLYPELFWRKPSDEADVWTDRKFSLKRVSRARRASDQPTFAAYGVIGRIAQGGGGNIIIMDDIEDDNNAHNLGQVQKTSRKARAALKCVDPSNVRFRQTWWANTQFAAGGPMARIHEDGFIRDIWLEPAVDYDRPNPDYGKGGLDIGGHEPVLFTAEELRDIRGEGADAWRDYCLQMLCRLDIAQPRALDPERMGTYQGDPGPLNYYLLMDPGGTPGTSPSQKLDDTAIWVVGLGRDHNARIVDGELDLMTLPERARNLIRLHRKWSQKGVVIEARVEECGTGGDCAHIAELQQQVNYEFPVVRMAWGGVGALSKKEREHRYIDRYLDNLLAPVALHRRRRGETMDLVANLRRQMEALAETDDDHPLDALALLGAPDDKEVRVYKGSRLYKRTLEALQWPKSHSRYLIENRRDPVDAVDPEHAWMIAGMGIGSNLDEEVLLG